MCFPSTTGGYRMHAARGTLLTGLYAPQTAIYADTSSAAAPAILNPAFPTWGEGVQALNAPIATTFGGLASGIFPSANSTLLQPHGFNTRTYPGSAAANPSTDGSADEGVKGGPYKGKVLASDAEIAGAFIRWLQGQTATPTKPARKVTHPAG